MKIKDLIKHYSEILSISDENIGFKNTEDIKQAKLGYDEYYDYWIIYFRKDCRRFPIIHELGHIYLAKKKFNYLGFAKPPPITPQTDKNLIYILSNLIDCFVNYNLSIIEPIYLEIQEYFHDYLTDLESIKNRIKSINNILLILSFYFLYYIEFKFILKEEDRFMLQENMNNLLNALRNNCIKRDDRLDLNKFEIINKILDKFDSFKTSNNYEEVLNFFLQVLKSTSFWGSDYLNNQFNLIFSETI
ncbi:hypothetical protein LCGC14_2234310 [marine sediment metagenome]|uniref:Uncharacterized protein n=1 Tax=marine sediment metagenome TaxID=412755 RepID=A0A0F9D721_9ZZZZ